MEVFGNRHSTRSPPRWPSVSLTSLDLLRSISATITPSLWARRGEELAVEAGSVEPLDDAAAQPSAVHASRRNLNFVRERLVRDSVPSEPVSPQDSLFHG
jgi:hypothetical protein